ncbi:hypothetical protein Peur_016150 [Populus x canadensis]
MAYLHALTTINCLFCVSLRELFCWSVDALQLAVTNFSADKHVWWLDHLYFAACSFLCGNGWFCYHWNE